MGGQKVIRKRAAARMQSHVHYTCACSLNDVTNTLSRVTYLRERGRIMQRFARSAAAASRRLHRQTDGPMLPRWNVHELGWSGRRRRRRRLTVNPISVGCGPSCSGNFGKVEGLWGSEDIKKNGQKRTGSSRLSQTAAAAAAATKEEQARQRSECWLFYWFAFVPLIASRQMQSLKQLSAVVATAYIVCTRPRCNIVGISAPYPNATVCNNDVLVVRVIRRNGTTMSGSGKQAVYLYIYLPEWFIMTSGASPSLIG